tara:strand:- start:1 stop:267 length:267 start_codon:yes stop_codon:yes gene_type:complete
LAAAAEVAVLKMEVVVVAVSLQLLVASQLQMAVAGVAWALAEAEVAEAPQETSLAHTQREELAQVVETLQDKLLHLAVVLVELQVVAL